MKILSMRLVALLLSFNAPALSAQDLSGKLANVVDGTVYLNYSVDGYYQRMDTVRLDKTGGFSQAFHFTGMRQVDLVAGDVSYKFTLFPDSKLSFAADFSNYHAKNASMRITGKGSEVNIEHFYSGDKTFSSLKWDYDLPPDSFVTRLTSWRLTKDSLRKMFVGRNAKRPYNKNIRQYLRTDSINDLYWTIGAFRDYHAVSLGRQSTADSFFQQRVKPFVFSTDDPGYLGSTQYVWFWDRYITNLFSWKRSSADSAEVKDTNWLAWRMEETKRLTTGKLQQMVLSNLIQSGFAYNYNYIDEASFPEYDSVLNKYGTELSNPAILRYVRDQISKIKDERVKTAKGKPVPDFSLTDSTGKVYTLKDFAGKLIYLDIWASWCGPCIGEIPDYKKLVEQFKNKDDIIFLSVSIDKEKDDWIQKGLLKHQPPGIQLWAGEKGWNSDFAKSYYISGVPQYVLIDKNGMIINFNAPRPSSGEKIGNAIRSELK